MPLGSGGHEIDLPAPRISSRRSLGSTRGARASSALVGAEYGSGASDGAAGVRGKSHDTIALSPHRPSASGMLDSFGLACHTSDKVAAMRTTGWSRRGPNPQTQNVHRVLAATEDQSR
jgi:hypothetical protein